MAIFVVCHGAWSSAWAWRKVRPLLRAAGHEIWTPSYTGLGERAHLASPTVDLELHIEDVLSHIHHEDLADIVLIGHSYGGMVATGVADRIPAKLRKLVYLDAFVPADGQSLNDLTGGARDAVDGWLVPPNPSAPDTAPEDLAWIAPRRHHQPARCFSQPLRLHGRAPSLERHYIWCSAKTGHDVFQQFADRIRPDPNWHFHERAWSHSPNVTAPAELAVLLGEIASK